MFARHMVHSWETTPREQMLTQACVCCSVCARCDTKSITFRLIFDLSYNEIAAYNSTNLTLSKIWATFCRNVGKNTRTVKT